MVGVQVASCQILHALGCPISRTKILKRDVFTNLDAFTSLERFECSCYVGKMFTDLAQNDPFIMDFGAENWTSF